MTVMQNTERQIRDVARTQQISKMASFVTIVKD